MTAFPECDCYLGRLKEICTGAAMVDGRPMDQAVINIWREQQGLPPIGMTVEQWDVSKKSRGLGDVIAKVTHFTGISSVVNAVSSAIGVPCGCGERQDTLNQVFPFKG